MNSDDKHGLVAFVLVIVLYAIMAGPDWIENYNRDRAFSSEIGMYQDFEKNTSSYWWTSGVSHVLGKAIVVDVNDGDIPMINVELKKSNFPIADTPDEAETVITLNYSESLVGGYTDGTKAYQKWCMITMIDKKTGTMRA
jgi:hypothetical protein